ncbi:MAG TPA: N-acetyltransferase [Chloroflexus aurantiacus]|jgi:GNAT superfamily N-acetyltransferase|uniref:GCN5-related N-acetyltransferase n=1 Tax=Chloroflexus aurantiacus (strain ATCC 29366 / DSM 635 / J-10-fl) TaxID=324602 RepID=A9WJ12_CHLAA|nr:GNAT family N-acetyltransferase [Chloroflexus aurantiacus]ABY36471.1 GCN5-related N-acetyltransferase [Chloroflexus aurantiacus J-10-fl]RMG53604.1 MAG: GNAT family N-acetyltransferase [Chloroflexota bacterium]GIV95299.1 MAG: N-acetyltransferase GCN5 [Chloroflexus sp.]HBW68877.1 N-acetyltransferase [Chloroflexus aurantiacus]
MNISIAATDDEIAACYPIMHQLRPHLTQSEFVPRIRRLMEMGYRLAALTDEGEVVAVAGFRFGENLAWGRFLYVDDLVTDANRRSRGYGSALLNWLKQHAAAAGCDQLHLDSGTWRKDAHRFYEREGMRLSSFHFVSAVRAE